MNAGDFQFGAPAWLHAAWIGPAILLAGVLAMRASRRALRRFIDEPMATRLAASVRSWARWVKLALTGAGAVLIAIALARPQTDPEPIEVETRGRDVVFVVDVSRSMLAQDLAPNRLDRSKLWVKDLAASLEGDRVGLIAFAGAAVVKCPLTLDRTFFGLALDELSPESAPVGGTYIGDAIRKAMDEVFEITEEDAGSPVTRDIILITDGEDQDSFPVDAAAAAGRSGIRVIAVGVGSESQGALVPDAVTGEALYYQGEPVRSRLNAKALSEIATASAGGVMLNVGTGTVKLDDVYADLTDDEALRATGVTETMKYTDRFYVPLGGALALLALAPLISERRRITR